MKSRWCRSGEVKWWYVAASRVIPAEAVHVLPFRHVLDRHPCAANTPPRRRRRRLRRRTTRSDRRARTLRSSRVEKGLDPGLRGDKPPVLQPLLAHRVRPRKVEGLKLLFITLLLRCLSLDSLGQPLCDILHIDLKLITHRLACNIFLDDVDVNFLYFFLQLHVRGDVILAEAHRRVEDLHEILEFADAQMLLLGEFRPCIAEVLALLGRERRILVLIVLVERLEHDTDKQVEDNHRRQEEVGVHEDVNRIPVAAPVQRPAVLYPLGRRAAPVLLPIGIDLARLAIVPVDHVMKHTVPVLAREESH
mmetsp:Transcript_3905/g.8117  ORF Transcript_3905/g.8117 Transcript_3905/m.8117 type:complete len:306 (-) Transcript_3905:1022-1939(-)